MRKIEEGEVRTLTSNVFSYGSNLNLSHLNDWLSRQRLTVVQRAVIVRSLELNRAVAHLADHSLVWNVPTETWRGGVANVVPQSGGGVYGIIYFTVSSSMVALLDRKEQHPNLFRRQPIQVTLVENGAAVSAWAYMAADSYEKVSPPSSLYLETVIQGARHSGLPSHWLDMLTKVSVLDR